MVAQVKLDPSPNFLQQILVLHQDRCQVSREKEILNSTLYKIPCDTVTETETVTEPRSVTSLPSDMLRAVRLVIWRDNLISRKDQIASSVENITTELERWMENVVKCMLQAA